VSLLLKRYDRRGSDVVVRIGIIGDFNSKYDTHVAINAAVEHTATALGKALHAEWLPTPDIAKPGSEKLLSDYHALWAAPVSPYESGVGMLRGIEYARSHNVPFTGT
jgi:CTP synthase (UTP-ammonia lyase)